MLTIKGRPLRWPLLPSAWIGVDCPGYAASDTPHTMGRTEDDSGCVFHAPHQMAGSELGYQPVFTQIQGRNRS